MYTAKYGDATFTAKTRIVLYHTSAPKLVEFMCFTNSLKPPCAGGASSLGSTSLFKYHDVNSLAAKATANITVKPASPPQKLSKIPRVQPAIIVVAKAVKLVSSFLRPKYEALSFSL